MSASAGRSDRSVLQLPRGALGYVAVVLALVTGVIHLLLSTRVMGFSQTLGILFVLNGLGFLGGTGVFLTRYWRRELYLVAAGYALVTFLAFFFWGGFGGFVSAFYMRGELNVMAVIAKAAELVLAGTTAYLYTDPKP
jgi:hypothetical protein